MYSFEGEFRRIPQQNLAGASKQEERQELLDRAHEGRLKREVSPVPHICDSNSRIICQLLNFVYMTEVYCFQNYIMYIM